MYVWKLWKEIVDLPHEALFGLQFSGGVLWK